MPDDWSEKVTARGAQPVTGVPAKFATGTWANKEYDDKARTQNKNDLMVNRSSFFTVTDLCCNDNGMEPDYI